MNEPQREGDAPPVDELRAMIHDLNGDIFLVRTCAEILLQQKGGDEKRLLDYLQKIVDRTQRMEVTVKELRKFKEARGL